MRTLFVQVRRAMVTLGWALLNFERDPALLKVLGVVDGKPLACRINKCYNLDGLTYDLTIEVEEPAFARSSSKENELCKVQLNVSRSPST